MHQPDPVSDHLLDRTVDAVQPRDLPCFLVVHPAWLFPCTDLLELSRRLRR